VSLVEFGASEADYRAAIESISRDSANAVMVVDSPEAYQNGTLIAKGGMFLTPLVTGNRRLLCGDARVADWEKAASIRRELERLPTARG
jgi:hypothetical protein